MDTKEKNTLVKKILDTEDDAILNQIREILDFSSRDFWNNINPKLKASLERAFEQSEKGEVTPHQEVMKELRNKYKA